MSNFVPWLRKLAEKGGKGVVGNIDARCLGRVADELERLWLVADAARLMPRATPQPGGCTTKHGYEIEAACVWALDRALKSLDGVKAP